MYDDQTANCSDPVAVVRIANSSCLDDFAVYWMRELPFDFHTDGTIPN